MHEIKFRGRDGEFNVAKFSKLEYDHLFFFIFLYISMIAALIIPYFKHIFWSFGLFMSDASIPLQKLALAILGIVLPFIGWLHGIYLYFV